MKSRIQPERSTLRVAELKARVPVRQTLMNVKVPSYLADAISEVAHRLNASKTDVVIALLNEGLAFAGKAKIPR